MGEINEVSSSNSLGFLRIARTGFLTPGTSGFVGSNPTSDKNFSPKSVIVGIPEKKFKQNFILGRAQIISWLFICPLHANLQIIKLFCVYLNGMKVRDKIEYVCISNDNFFFFWL